MQHVSMSTSISAPVVPMDVMEFVGTQTDVQFVWTDPPYGTQSRQTVQPRGGPYS